MLLRRVRGTLNPGYRYTSFVKLPLSSDFKQRRLAAALNRLVNSPLKRRHPTRVARQALSFVRAEG